MREELSLEIPGEPQYISVARLAASGLAKRLNFSEEDIEDIKVSLSEACNTIIENGKKTHENIDISFRVSPDSLTIEVDAEGDELAEKVWEKRHELGKTFVETLMDNVKYMKRKGKGTSVEMVKYLHGTANKSLKYRH